MSAASQRPRPGPADQAAGREVRRRCPRRPASSDRRWRRLADGAVIPLAAARSRNPEIEEVLGALSLLLNGGGLEQIKTITHELNAGAVRAFRRHPQPLSEGQRLAASLNTQKERITARHRQRRRARPPVAASGRSWRAPWTPCRRRLKILADEKTQFVTLLRSLDKLSTVAVRVINASQDDFVSALTSLDPAMTQLTLAGRRCPSRWSCWPTTPSADRGQRHQGRLHQPLPDRRPEPHPPAGQPAQATADAAAGDPAGPGHGPGTLTGLGG